MRILTGDECGLLKEFVPSQVSAKHSSKSVVTTVTQQGIHRVNPSEIMARRHAVVGMTWMPEHNHWAALRVDGTVQVWEGTYESPQQTGSYRLNAEIPRVFSNSTQTMNGQRDKEELDSNNSSSSDDDDDISIQRRGIGIHSWSMHNRLVACNAAGTIAVVNPFAPEPDDCVVDTFETFSTTNNNNNKNSNNHSNKTNGGSILTTAFAFNEQDGIVAVGAKDREMVLWNVETGKSIWKAKNLPPDPQTLLQPRVWPTTACFFSDNNNLMAVGSAYHQVRIYDVRAATTTISSSISLSSPSSSSSSPTITGAATTQRRPIQYTDEKNQYLEHRVTALCPLGRLSSHEIVVGDAGGYIQSLDLRLLSGGANVQRAPIIPVVGRYVGPAGSVRQLILAPLQNRLVCVGLDRMLRVYKATTRQPLQTVYLKQRLNCVLVADEEPGILQNENEDDDDDIDQEDNVQDYVASDEEEEDGQCDDEVEETMDEIVGESSSSDDDDSEEEEDNDIVDSDVESSSEEAETAPKKRRRK